MISPNSEFEQSLVPHGTRYILGIDEVGRGPLAGPVTIGAFILDLTQSPPPDVRDSKLLSASKRQQLYQSFLDNSCQFTTFSASSTEIDRQGIAPAIYFLIAKALKYYDSIFDYCLIDGNYNIDHPRVLSVTKGDQKCFSVASASIVAKVVRDLEMQNYHQLYPQYDFKNNVGYGTAKHLSALKIHGPCPIHRRSFSPVSEYSTF